RQRRRAADVVFSERRPGPHQQLFRADRLSAAERRSADRRDRGQVRRLRRAGGLPGGARRAGRRVSKTDRHLARLLRCDSASDEARRDLRVFVRRLPRHRRARRGRKIFVEPSGHARARPRRRGSGALLENSAAGRHDFHSQAAGAAEGRQRPRQHRRYRRRHRNRRAPAGQARAEADREERLTGRIDRKEPVRGVPMAELYPYPRFSIAERDRRWRAVRALMRGQNLDVIVTPQNSGHSADYQANTRYLTHCGGGEPDLAAVFPLEGEVTAIATSAAPRWPTVQDWVSDVREARRNYGRAIVERLKELNVERGRIGITGLGEVEGTRTP